MKLALAGALLSALCTAQEMPVAGVFRDSQGALRLLQGVEGAWVAPILIPSGIVSAGYNGRTLWYKIGADLHVLTSGRHAVVPVPEGPAVGRFSPNGELEMFDFPEAGLAVPWISHSMTLGALQFRSNEATTTPPAEPLGDGLLLLRRNEAILAWRPGSEPTLIPLAETSLFQLFFRDASNEATETLAGPTFTLPPAAPGESSEARFRIRNPGASSILINRLSIDPSVFKTFDQFFPPRFIEPGGFADFSIRFSPTAPGGYSSTLYVNDLKVILNAFSDAAPVVEIQLPSGWTNLRAGNTVDLGSVERRATLRRPLRIQPAAPLKISGDGFSLVSGAAPSDFDLLFSSDKPGPASATLESGGRFFPFKATVTDFPPPRPSLLLPNEPISSARQVKLTVRLSEPARAEYLSALSLTFTPDAGLPDDPAVAFLPQAVRNVPLRFPAGASESPEIVLQTGATAGRITLKVTLGPNSDERTLLIATEPAVLTATKAAIASAAAEVILTGFDTSRSVSRLAFTFYLKDGQPAAPGRIEADVTAPFSTYFKSVAGGAFSLRANFPVSGTHTELDGVEVEITNSNGTRRTGRLRFE